MAFISFALTKNELLSGRKSCTRRDWSEGYRKLWQKWYREGKRTHEAWDKIPIAGGKKIGNIELTCEPYAEKLSEMPIEDLEAEGGMCKTIEEFCRFIKKEPKDAVTVIRFRFYAERIV